MIVLVTGSRDWKDEGPIHRVMQTLWSVATNAGETFILVEGMARGADSIARKWMNERHLDQNVRSFAADWAYYGAAAGPIRNQKMLDATNPDFVIAFPMIDEATGTWSRGTQDMVDRATRADKPILVFHEDGTVMGLCGVIKFLERYGLTVEYMGVVLLGGVQ
jgi:hypothetical protein